MPQQMQNQQQQPSATASAAAAVTAANTQQQQNQPVTTAQTNQNGISTTAGGTTSTATITSSATSAKMIPKTEPCETNDEPIQPPVEIKQEIMEASPGNGNPVTDVNNGTLDMGQNIKLEPNEMKPPPEKKMKL